VLFLTIFEFHSLTATDVSKRRSLTADLVRFVLLHIARKLLFPSKGESRRRGTEKWCTQKGEIAREEKQRFYCSFWSLDFV
jgi:hypothetical protein